MFFTKIDFKNLLSSSKKSKRRQLQITDACIDLLFEEGLENFSYEKISKKCSIARSLIYNYFPTLTEMLLFTSAYIRYEYQDFVLRNMIKATSIQETLELYIQSALAWSDVKPKHVRVWLIYFHKCATITKLENHNRILVDIGTKRIKAMIHKGIEQGVFVLAPQKVHSSARMIQYLIIGGLVSRITEQRSDEDWRQEFRFIQISCMSLVGIKAPE